MTIRPATKDDIPAIARVHIASWRTTYRGLLPDEFLASLSQDKHESRHVRMMAQPGNVCLLAEDDTAGIAGFITGGPERSDDPDYRGEIYAIYLLESHQHKGVGKALVTQFVNRLHASQIRSMIVWVLEGNPAQSFYERLGGKALRTQTLTIAGVSREEIALVWDDTSVLR